MNIAVDLKDMSIVTGGIYHDEETDWTAPITVTAKVNSNKESYDIAVKIASKDFPDDAETRFKFLGALGECIMQAAAQAERQIMRPLQLDLFASYGLTYSEPEKAIADNIRTLMEKGVTVEMGEAI